MPKSIEFTMISVYSICIGYNLNSPMNIHVWVDIFVLTSILHVFGRSIVPLLSHCSILGSFTVTSKADVTRIVFGQLQN